MEKQCRQYRYLAGLVQSRATLGWLHRHARPQELSLPISPLTGLFQADSFGVRNESADFEVKTNPGGLTKSVNPIQTETERDIPGTQRFPGE